MERIGIALLVYRENKYPGTPGVCFQSLRYRLRYLKLMLGTDQSKKIPRKSVTSYFLLMKSILGQSVLTQVLPDL